MLPILGLGVWPIVLTQTIDPSLFAIGKSRYVAYGCFLSFLFLATGIPLGFYLMGPVGAVIAVPFNNLPFYGAITYGLWCERLACIGQDIKATALFLVLLSIALVGRIVLGFGLPIDNLL
jgi:hypothetical protein